MSTQYDKKGATYLEEYTGLKKLNYTGKRTKQKIYHRIKDHNFLETNRYPQGGIKVQDIARELDINKSTVIRYCEQLESEGIIKKKNKQSEYHLTPKGYDDRILWAMIYERRSKLWEVNIPLEMPLISKRKGKIIMKRITQNYFWDFNKISRLAERREFGYDDPTIEFLKFANEIGAEIIYLFLEAIKPDNRINVSGKRRDQLIKDWLIGEIDPITIFYKFCKLSAIKEGQPFYGTITYDEKARDIQIRRIKQKVNLSEEEKVKAIRFYNEKFEHYSKYRKYTPEISRYELDTNTSKKLFKTYREAFPAVFYKISKYAEQSHEQYREARNHAT